MAGHDGRLAPETPLDAIGHRKPLGFGSESQRHVFAALRKEKNGDDLIRAAGASFKSLGTV